MTTVTAVTGAAQRARRVTGAFMWLGATETVAYPMSVVLTFVVGPSSVPVMYYFVARLANSGPSVGSDYYTYLMLGFVGATALTGGLTAFGRSLNTAIQQGQFETYLVQPISWYTLPFALAAWPIVQSLLVALVMMLLALAFGAQIDLAGVPLALVVLGLGIAATHAIGTLAASVRVLSKKADPVVAFYTLAASIFGGQLFPITMLPVYIRPVAYLLPHTYVLNAMRKLLMPETAGLEGPSVMVSILILVGITMVLYVVCLYAFGRALEFGRRYGVLGGY